MGTLMKRVHALPGTTSSNVVERGDYASEKQAIFTLSEFERIFALDVLGPYHNDLHSALGKTPASAWAEGLAATGDPRLPLDPKGFVLDFLPFQERLVGRQGVRIFNTMYFDGALASLLGTTDRKRRVKYDPGDLSAVFVEMPDGSHIRVPYADLRKPPVTLWEHRAAAAALRERGRGTVDEDAIFRAIEGKRRILIDAQAQSKNARRNLTRSPMGRDGISVAEQLSPKHSRSDAITRHPSNNLDDDEEAKVPQIAEDEAWKTDFLS